MCIRDRGTYQSTSKIVRPAEEFGVYHTPLARLSKLDCPTTKRVPIPNDAFSESSHRDVSNADRFGTGSIPTVEISRMENRPRGGGDIHRRIRVHQRETRARPMMGDPINGLCWCIPGITVTHG